MQKLWCVKFPLTEGHFLRLLYECQRCKQLNVRSIQSTENAHDGPNLSRGASSARPADGFRHGSFGTCLSVGVADGQFYDRHHRQAAGVRAVLRDSDAAGRLADGGSIVALSAAEESFAFAQG